jgi:hypothetical protein
VRSVTWARRSIEVAELVAALRAGAYGHDDLLALGAAIGRLLGAGHGRSAGAAILSAAGDGEIFVEDTARRALAEVRRLEADFQLFQRALASRGPLLGARP